MRLCKALTVPASSRRDGCLRALTIQLVSITPITPREFPLPGTSKHSPSHVTCRGAEQSRGQQSRQPITPTSLLLCPPWRGPGESNGPGASEIRGKSQGCWDVHLGASQVPAPAAKMHGKDWGSGSPRHRRVAQHTGVSRAQMGSTQPLLCQCCKLALPTPTVLPYCPAPAMPTGQQLPTASTRDVRSDGCNGGKHKKLFIFLQTEKEVSHLDMYSSGLGKGQGVGRREAVGREAQHRPEDVVRQMADLAARWSRSDLQALPAARAGDITLRRSCQLSLAGLGGGVCCILSNTPHPTASIRDAPRASQPWKKAIWNRAKWEERPGWQVLAAGKQRDCPQFLCTRLPSLHTGPRSQAGAWGRAGSPCATLSALLAAWVPRQPPLPSTASPLMWKRKEIKHEALQQMAAKGASPSPCHLSFQGTLSTAAPAPGLQPDEEI